MKKKSELKNSVIDIKNTLKGLSRLEEGGKQISKMEDRVMESNHAEQKIGKKKNNKRE